MTERSGAPPFVGRRDELRRLDAAASRAGAGEPQFVALGGEAGVGKTRLLEHFAARLTDAGTVVLRGGCVELGTEGLPLAPIRVAVRDLIHQRGVAGLPGGDALARLVPELTSPAPHPDGRAGVFDSLATLLHRLSTEAPVLVVLDDLHWADRSTRELIGFLARTLRSGRVVMLLAYRSDDLELHHPLRGFLAELARLPRVHRMELHRLTRSETAELLAELLGQRPDPELVDRIYRRSQGNALCTEELARAADPDAMPASLRDLLLRRVGQLPVQVRHVIQIAAVGGHGIRHDLLAAIAGLGEEELLDALRVASDARVLIPEGDGYGFRHPLFREALAEDLVPAQRRRLHRRFAEALDADPDLVEADRFAAQIAFHWHEAGDPVHAFPALLRAAALAEDVSGHAEQAQMLQRALTLWPQLPEGTRPSGREVLDLFDTAISAAAWAGDHVRARQLTEQALQVVELDAVPERAAMLLAHRALALHSLSGAGVLAAVQQAMSLLPAGRTLARARVLDLLAAVLVMRGRPAQARDTAAEAMELASELGEADLEIAARITLGWAQTELGDYADAVRTLRAARELSERRDAGVQLVRVCLNLTHAWRGLARYDDAVKAARAGLAAVRSAGVERAFGGMLHLALVSCFTAVGRWDEAETALDRALQLDPPENCVAACHAARVEIALARGELHSARDQLSAALPLIRPGSRALLIVRQAQAQLALYENRMDEARAALTGAVTQAGQWGTPPLVWELLTTGARIASRSRLPAGAAEDASVLDHQLSELASGLRADSPVLSAYAAEFDAEIGAPYSSWAEVAAAWEAAGQPMRTCYARLRAAESLLAAGNREAARNLLLRAEEAASQLGAAPLLAEIQLLARTAQVHLTPDAAPTSPASRLGLTDREVEVLRLVSEGRSNRQIAEALFISPKTVSTHVSHILTKCGATTRGEAAATAHRLRLFSPTP